MPSYLIHPRSDGRQASPHKQALIDFIASQGATFLITAELPPPAGRDALEDALYGWQCKVNRHYGGHRWTAPHRADLRMCGVVVFETRGDYLHAHLVVCEPARATPFHFRLNAPSWWREVAPGGTMHVTSIEQTPADMARVAAYITKDLGWTRTVGDVWKFVDDLSRRQVPT